MSNLEAALAAKNRAPKHVNGFADWQEYDRALVERGSLTIESVALTLF